MPLDVGELRGSLISIAGPTAPGLLGDLDAARVGRDLLPRIKENFEVINRNASTWLVVPGPVEGWAQQVYPDADEPLDKLWEQIAHVCRLDTDDPVAAWRERFGQTADVGRRLMELELDAVHFEGPGHRPHNRPAADVEVAERERDDDRRHRLRPEPPVGGADRDAGPAARGRAWSVRRGRSC